MDPSISPALNLKIERNECRLDAKKMDHRRLTSAVFIHAAAFIVAVVSLGSGTGIGGRATADIKADRVGRKQPVQAIGFQSHPAIQAIRVAKETSSYADQQFDSSGSFEAFAPVSASAESVIPVQFQSSQQ